MTRAAFYDAIRPTFGGKLTAPQVSGLEVLLTATEGLPLTHRAYCLGTAFHETGQRMQPVRECFAASDGETVRRLDAAWKKGQLTWVKAPYWRPDADGKSWFGRGYVQITHKVNYDKLGKRIGVDLVADPSAALSPFLAAKILVVGMAEGLFTGKRLSDFLPGNYTGARQIINPDGNGQAIAGYAAKFEAAIMAGEAPETVPDHHPPVRPDVVPAVSAPQSAAAWWVRAICGIFDSLFAKWRT